MYRMRLFTLPKIVILQIKYQKYKKLFEKVF